MTVQPQRNTDSTVALSARLRKRVEDTALARFTANTVHERYTPRHHDQMGDVCPDKPKLAGGGVTGRVEHFERP